MSDQPTLPDDDGSVRKVPVRRTTTLALVIVSHAEDPSRIGEILPVPARGEFVLGRGGDRDDDPHPRLSVVRARPGATERRPALDVGTLSRRQAVVRATGDGGVSIENQGRTRLVVDGVETGSAQLRPGAVVEIGTQLALLLVARGEMPPALDAYPGFAFGQADPFGIVGESPAAWRLRARLAFVAKREGHVLVRGPSGAGKELVAAAIHALSERARGPLVARNAATFPEGLIDAELFGNVRGYPNPGSPERSGLIGAADGGTLLLDEFAELPVPQQTHLLRVLDAGEYHRLGESTARQSRFRLLGATNRGLDRIKDDVAARFSFQIEVPPLVERREDIPLLCQHLMTSLAARDPDLRARFFVGERPRLHHRLLRALLRHELSTNVRELRNLLLASASESHEGTLDVPAQLTSEARVVAAPASTPPAANDPDDDAGAAGDVSPARIQAALDANNGSIEDTWRSLGLPSRHALGRLVRKHGIEVRRRPK